MVGRSKAQGRTHKRPFAFVCSSDLFCRQDKTRAVHRCCPPLRQQVMTPDRPPDLEGEPVDYWLLGLLPFWARIGVVFFGTDNSPPFVVHIDPGLPTASACPARVGK